LLKACDGMMPVNSLPHMGSWESVWPRSREPAKTFLQGLIQVAAAFHHLELTIRYEPRCYRKLRSAGSSVIRPTLEVFVTLLCDDIRERLQALEAGQRAPNLCRPWYFPSDPQQPSQIEAEQKRPRSSQASRSST